MPTPNYKYEKRRKEIEKKKKKDEKQRRKQEKKEPLSGDEKTHPQPLEKTDTPQ